jgi:DNA-binding IclR family transcriptional regulator
VLAEVRRRKMTRAMGDPLPGVNAFAAPVFDHTGTVVLAITAMGPAGSFDANWTSPIAAAVRECADTVSQRLGYRAGMESRAEA